MLNQTHYVVGVKVNEQGFEPPLAIFPQYSLSVTMWEIELKPLALYVLTL